MKKIAYEGIKIVWMAITVCVQAVQNNNNVK